MINFEVSVPTVWWAYERLDDLKHNEGANGFGGSVWLESPIVGTVVLSTDSIAFEAPENWDNFGKAIRLNRVESGLFTGRSDEESYDAAVCETSARIIVTGRSNSKGIMGVFVAIFPKEVTRR